MQYPKYIETEQLHRESDEVLERKVSALLREMTLEEKMDLCHGHMKGRGVEGNGGYNPGVPRLGVPEIRMYDGPAGVTSLYDTTGLPVQEMLAAAWDPDLAYQYGKVEGTENYAISGNTQLGSEFDIVRTPQFGRNRDMLGEDPFLTSSLCVPETKGIQDQHAVATLKHFAVCCQDTVIQNAADQLVDEQTLHEIYFPSFEAAAKEGRAGSFMCSYNKYNGSYAAANEYMQKTVLRDMWNYKGYMMSDWGSNHSLSVHKGMDMEMPHGVYNSNERLHLALKKGRLTEQDIEDAAGHVLYGFGMVGYLSLVELDEAGNVRIEEGRTEPIRMKDRYEESVKAGLLKDNAEICLNVARKGAVLLKNENRALPLTEADYTGENSVAMLGLGAVALISGTAQERSYGSISRMKAPADEVRRLAGKDARIESAIAMDIFGTTVPTQYLFQDEALTKPGLVRTYGVGKEDGGPVGIFAMMMNMEKDKKDEMPAPPAAPVGGAGVEFKGTAAADNDDDSDVVETHPMMDNGIEIDMEGHETGSFCCVDDKLEFTVGTIDGLVNKTYKNSADGTAFPTGSGYVWKGYLTVPSSGEYDLIFQAIGGNASCRISLNGTAMTSVGSTEMREGAHWPWDNLVCSPEGMNLSGGKFQLEAGKAYKITVAARAASAEKDLQLRLAWITPEQRERDYRKALDIAAKAKKVVLFLTTDYSYRPAGMSFGFGFDSVHMSSLEIPAAQKKLLEDVKKVMKKDAKLVIVSNNGNVFSMEWHEQADAILNVFTPGQEGGTAIAEILTGKVNPSGKMAVTIPEKNTDTLASDTPEHTARRYESYVGEDGKKYVDHDEGIFTGYRWYDKEGVKPLYAFGHGLSYSTFAYSDLSVQGTDVTFTVQNTGTLPGTEIAQVYLGEAAVPEGIQMAKKQLCGFKRLEDMQPGEARTVTISIPARSFCYWDPNNALSVREDGTKDKWVKTTGNRKIMVGGSSAYLPLTAEITV